MAFTTGGPFRGYGDLPFHSQNTLVAGSSDACCSRRSRRLTLQPFEL